MRDAQGTPTPGRKSPCRPWFPRLAVTRKVQLFWEGAARLECQNFVK